MKAQVKVIRAKIKASLKLLFIALTFFFFIRVSKQLPVTGNYLVTNILQNIFFCVQQKKETYTGLEQLEVE